MIDVSYSQTYHQSHMDNMVQKFLASRNIDYELSIEKLVDFYGLSKGEAGTEVIMIDDAQPCFKSQVGSAYIDDPVRWRPTLLPPLEWRIRTLASEQEMFDELCGYFGDPTKTERLSNAICREWKKDLGSVEMTFFPGAKNNGKDSCSVSLKSGFRRKLSELEKRALTAIEKLAIPAGSKYRNSQIDEIQSEIHLGLIRDVRARAFTGLGFDDGGEFLCVGDRRQCAFLEIKRILRVRLLLSRFRSQVWSTLCADYEDRFSPRHSQRSLDIFSCDNHSSLMAISQTVAKRTGKELVIERSESDY